MADAQTAITIKAPKKMMDSNDLRKGGWQCSCSICQSARNDGGETEFEALFTEYDAIGSDDWEEDRMTAHQYLLCPFVTRVFVFRTRAWGKAYPKPVVLWSNSKTERVHVKNLSVPHFDETMVNNLIIDKKKKLTLTTLAKSFARRNKTGVDIPKPMWSADFVEGKGTGVIFLLHGKPGVGKTLTAGKFGAYTADALLPNSIT